MIPRWSHECRIVYGPSNQRPRTALRCHLKCIAISRSEYHVFYSQVVGRFEWLLENNNAVLTLFDASAKSGRRPLRRLLILGVTRRRCGLIRTTILGSYGSFKTELSLHNDAARLVPQDFQLCNGIQCSLKQHKNKYTGTLRNPDSRISKTDDGSRTSEHSFIEHLPSRADSSSLSLSTSTY